MTQHAKLNLQLHCLASSLHPFTQCAGTRAWVGGRPDCAPCCAAGDAAAVQFAQAQEHDHQAPVHSDPMLTSPADRLSGVPLAPSSSHVSALTALDAAEHAQFKGSQGPACCQDKSPCYPASIVLGSFNMLPLRPHVLSIAL